MDFLNALVEAQKQGFTKEEFLKIWEMEAKVIQLKEEARLMDLKLEYEKVPVRETDSKLTQQQLESILQQHCMEHQQQLLELKKECQKQNELHSKKISKLLETQASLVALVIRNETEVVMKQFCKTKSKPPSLSNSHGGFGEQNFSSIQNSNSAPQQTETKRQQSENEHQLQVQVPSEEMNAIDDDLDSMIPCLPQDGVEYHVKDLSKIVQSKQIQISPLYMINECLSKVRLSLWFDESGKLNVRCSISELHLKFFQPPKVFKCDGFIKNKNSKSYSMIFQGESPPIQSLQALEKKEFPVTVCLKTGSGKYENVTFQDLEARNFVLDDVMALKWLVTSHDAVAQNE